MTQELQPSAWSLADLLPATSGPAFDSLLEELNTQVEELEQWRGRLTPDIAEEDWVRLVRQYETITEHGSRLLGYGRLSFAADTQSQEALSFMGRMEELLTDVQNRLIFLVLWWKSLDDANAQRLLSAASEWHYFLESLRRFKPHTLSELEEKVINLKDVNGVNALTTIYDMITNKYSFQLVVEGETRHLTRDQLRSYVHSPVPEVREAAYREMRRVYAQDGAVLGQLYIHRARDWRNEQMNLRRFSSPIAVRNLENDIPDPVVDTLLQVCQENTLLFQDYFRLKADWLGMDRLRRFDLYAPLDDTDRQFAYHEAVEMVLESFERFSPVVANQARRILAENHMDSEIRAGKEGGAFCASPLPRVAPWVKVNFTGECRDVATLAHELGHAVHALMAADHSILTFHSALPMAEIASVFGEMLLTERLLAEEPNRAVRRNLLAAQMDDAYATVMRQAFFVLFEREAHRMIAEGKNTNDLCTAYLDNLHQQFGDAVEVDDGFRSEWVAIPHIYQVPFYCYAYSFGQLMVLSLYQRYKEEGQAFVPRYLRILEYGGSASPGHILTEAGIDMTSSSFWQGGFDVIRSMVNQLVALPA
jgi:oligoendopeptidase F